MGADVWFKLAMLVVSSLLCVAGQVIAKVGLEQIGGVRWQQPLDAFASLIASPHLWLAGLALVVGTLLFFDVLAVIEISVALPIACVLTLVFSVLFGMFLFGEAIGSIRWLGLVLAAVSVVLIASAPAPT